MDSKDRPKKRTRSGYEATGNPPLRHACTLTEPWACGAGWSTAGNLCCFFGGLFPPSIFLLFLSGGARVLADLETCHCVFAAPGFRHSHGDGERRRAVRVTPGNA